MKLVGMVLFVVILLMFLSRLITSSRLCPRLCSCIGKKVSCRGIKSKTDFQRIMSEVPKEIKQLDLSRNNISDIFYSEKYERLKHLEVLMLNENLLTKIPGNLSLFLPSVRVLRMRGNHLMRDIPRSNIATAFNLEVLDLSNCSVGQLEDMIFHNNTRLKTLNIRNNKLRSIHKNAFVGLAKLDSLKLDHNHLVDLPPQVFQSLKMMARLSIAYNRLRSIPENLFKYNSQLKVINFAANHIRELGTNVFRNPHVYTTINLQFNKISIFPWGSLNGTRVSKGVYLKGNPIHCNCPFLILSRHIEYLKLIGYCETPIRLKGRNFSTLSVKGILNCSRDLNGTRQPCAGCENTKRYCWKQSDRVAYCACPKEPMWTFCTKIHDHNSITNTKKNMEWIYTLSISLFIVVLGALFAVWYYKKRKGVEMCSRTKCWCSFVIGTSVMLFALALLFSSAARFN